mmetsp:Transcript_24702/g.82856  ORF Transcript_24702/g.82856 Transcript_24702/m.82856 type:complete len:365 (+) Transcript_24702:1294-2388(+)
MAGGQDEHLALAAVVPGAPGVRVEAGHLPIRLAHALAVAPVRRRPVAAFRGAQRPRRGLATLAQRRGAQGRGGGGEELVARSLPAALEHTGPVGHPVEAQLVDHLHLAVWPDPAIERAFRVRRPLLQLGAPRAEGHARGHRGVEENGAEHRVALPPQGREALAQVADAHARGADHALPIVDRGGHVEAPQGHDHSGARALALPGHGAAREARVGPLREERDVRPHALLQHGRCLSDRARLDKREGRAGAQARAAHELVLRHVLRAHHLAERLREGLLLRGKLHGVAARAVARRQHECLVAHVHVVCQPAGEGPGGARGGVAQARAQGPRGGGAASARAQGTPQEVARHPGGRGYCSHRARARGG